MTRVLLVSFALMFSPFVRAQSAATSRLRSDRVLMAQAEDDGTHAPFEDGENPENIPLLKPSDTDESKAGDDGKPLKPSRDHDADDKFILKHCQNGDEVRGFLGHTVVCVMYNLHCDEAMVSKPNDFSKVKGVIAYCKPKASGRCPEPDACATEKGITAEQFKQIKFPSVKTGESLCLAEDEKSAAADTTAAAAPAPTTQTTAPPPATGKQPSKATQ